MRISDRRVSTRSAQAAYLLGRRGQVRVRELPLLDQLVCRLAELLVRVRERALGLNVVDALLDPGRCLISGRLGLVQKSHHISPVDSRRMFPIRTPPAPPVPLASPVHRDSIITAPSLSTAPLPGWGDRGGARSGANSVGPLPRLI